MGCENVNPITDTPIDFYTAQTPNGLKISIYLQEAGIAHRSIAVNLSAGEQNTVAYRRVNPNGKIPAIIDHEEGVTVFESGAILSYLSEKTGCLRPESWVDRLTVQQWLYFQVGSIGPMLGQLGWFLHASPTHNHEAIARYRKEAVRLYGVVNSRLSESAFIATSQFSIADIAAYCWLRTWQDLNLDISSYEHVLRWLDRIALRPAVQQALAWPPT